MCPHGHSAIAEAGGLTNRTASALIGGYMDYSGYTTEQLVEALDTSVSNYNALTEQHNDIIAERDSLKDELDSTKQTLTGLQQELAETKKLNFTLARQVDSSTQTMTVEQILNNLFNGGKSDDT